MLQKTPIALAVAALLAPLATFADEAVKADSSEHDHKYERIIVTASPLEKSAINSAQPIHVLSDDELRQAQAATLGETLRGIPGVQSSYFGPTASSPVIRGLDGPRVKVVQNGLDAADISRGGPDHAVSTESSTAQQIEIFRGPSTLLFGSGASGGVVNVVDNRVPRYSVQGVSGYYGAGYNSGANERNVSAGVDAGKNDIAVHLDIFKRKGDDYDVPGFIDQEGHLTKTIDNSFTDDLGYNIGASYFLDSGFIGFSYGRMERDYGLPGHTHGEEGHDDTGEAHEEHDDIFASFVQDRYQVLGSFLEPVKGFKRLDVNFGFTEMVHDEIEGDVIETGFTLKQTELRLTAAHHQILGWDGALGVQVQNQKYTSSGIEAFTPDSETELAGLFWLVEKSIDKVTFEGGARIEEVKIKTDDFSTLKYTPVSASLGASYRATEQLIYSMSLSYSERAPQANELFSNGAHFATRSYEMGGFYELHEDHHAPTDPGYTGLYHIAPSADGLSKEQASNIDLGLHYDGLKFHLDASLFYNRISDFIYQTNTGIGSDMLELAHNHDDHGADTPADHHGHDHSDVALPIYAYQQQDADLYGYELAGHYEFNAHWHVGAFSDYTRAKFAKGDGANRNIPRIPAQRAGLHLSYMTQGWDTKISYTHHFSQNKITNDEERTESFGMLSANLNYYPSYFAGQDVAIYVKAENITNQLGYAHNSFIKDFAPLPGRSIGIGIRAQF